MKRVASFKTELIKALQNKTDGAKCSPTHLLFCALLSRFKLVIFYEKKPTQIEDRGLVNASFKNPLFPSYIFTKVEMISAEVINCGTPLFRQTTEFYTLDCQVTSSKKFLHKSSSCRTLNALVSVNCQLDTSPVRTKITAATSSLSVSTDPLANTGVYVQAVNATHDR